MSESKRTRARGNPFQIKWYTFSFVVKRNFKFSADSAGGTLLSFPPLAKLQAPVSLLVFNGTYTEPTLDPYGTGNIEEHHKLRMGFRFGSHGK
jgi:hypothetical protein